jgi:predicted aspartyl protease
VIRGVVSAIGVPTIILTVGGKDWEATIDTGFNGDVELPEILRESLNPRSVGRATAALAGGQSIEEEVFLVEFPFDGRKIQTEATFVAGSHILIGTHLLREYSLRIDFVRKTVELERLVT